MAIDTTKENPTGISIFDDNGNKYYVTNFTTSAGTNWQTKSYTAPENLTYSLLNGTCEEYVSSSTTALSSIQLTALLASGVKSFIFPNLTTLPSRPFCALSRFDLKNIFLPRLSYLPEYAFTYAAITTNDSIDGIDEITFDHITTIGDYCFDNYSGDKPLLVHCPDISNTKLGARLCAGGDFPNIVMLDLPNATSYLTAGYNNDWLKIFVPLSSLKTMSTSAVTSPLVRTEAFARDFPIINFSPCKFPTYKTSAEDFTTDTGTITMTYAPDSWMTSTATNRNIVMKIGWSPKTGKPLPADFIDISVQKLSTAGLKLDTGASISYSYSCTGSATSISTTLTATENIADAYFDTYGCIFFSLTRDTYPTDDTTIDIKVIITVPEATKYFYTDKDTLKFTATYTLPIAAYQTSAAE